MNDNENKILKKLVVTDDAMNFIEKLSDGVITKDFKGYVISASSVCRVHKAFNKIAVMINLDKEIGFTHYFRFKCSIIDKIAQHYIDKLVDYMLEVGFAEISYDNPFEGIVEEKQFNFKEENAQYIDDYLFS